MAITGGVQFGSMVVAAYFLEKVTTSRADELANLPYDEEVKAAEDAAAHEKEVYTRVTQWDVVPALAKTFLILSVSTMVISCYTVQLFSADCFADYELTFTIGEHLDGNVLNLVLPLGWIAIILFIASCIFLLIFVSWAKRKTKEVIKEEKSTMLATSHEKDKTEANANPAMENTVDSSPS
eukprot:CAMPEP_0195514806 /NCGR_PEP_ID=MMETSP0794_2-20130614/6084_1 /TAXON_ID=515487 /ORGANISM="Stephanopyxis turris, Strain CCMP 815" /LENGTH=180 /DNA_ID=CAMNT_0040643129 /DNA_START=1833 /DNA_END=2375 /DNA_ORIENTATION=+